MKYNKLFLGTETELLDDNNFANLFNVIQLNEKSYFNINKTIHIKNMDNISSAYYTTYECKSDDTWPLISYKFYNTYKLWWVICKVNNIKNPFVEIVGGKRIKILNMDKVKEILNTIKEL